MEFGADSTSEVVYGFSAVLLGVDSKDDSTAFSSQLLCLLPFPEVSYVVRANVLRYSSSVSMHMISVVLLRMSSNTVDLSSSCDIFGGR